MTRVTSPRSLGGGGSSRAEVGRVRTGADDEFDCGIELRMMRIEGLPSSWCCRPGALVCSAAHQPSERRATAGSVPEDDQASRSGRSLPDCTVLAGSDFGTPLVTCGAPWIRTSLARSRTSGLQASWKMPRIPCDRSYRHQLQVSVHRCYWCKHEPSEALFSIAAPANRLAAVNLWVLEVGLSLDKCKHDTRTARPHLDLATETLPEAQPSFHPLRIKCLFLQANHGAVVAHCRNRRWVEPAPPRRPRHEASVRSTCADRGSGRWWVRVSHHVAEGMGISNGHHTVSGHTTKSYCPSHGR
ncbi:hypothetical protein DFH27DRAFT_146661 [Peziza echinospora]|nr:hypothetical protein DFH27DRAFT_146661 [Peziza echinospora]